MDRLGLAIVIPAYCEAATIGRVVEAAKLHGQVIVVDDCSPDETGSAAVAAGAHVVRNPANYGYDAALSRGFEEAARMQFSHVLTIDADGEHAPALISIFRGLMLDEGIPLVLGIRPRKQRLAEVLVGAYVRARFGVRDIFCGMKGYDMALWRTNDGFDHSDSVGTELALNSIRRGVPFRQVNVFGTPRADAPRFDRRLRANMRIFGAIWRAMNVPLEPSARQE